MIVVIPTLHRRRAVSGLAILLVLAASSATRGQGPQVDVEDPPGAPAGRGRLGPALGASGTSAFDVVPPGQGPVGGRPGPSASRAPIDALNPEPGRPVSPPEARFQPPVLEPATVPLYGDLDVPAGSEDLGPEDGLILDAAISRLLRQNLDLIALQFEIPMARADVLTAGLRANPIFYADTQLVPYGQYSKRRPGGPTQYDVNITYPLDIWRKRQARTGVAEMARRVTEAQFQDAVRLQIDNLYTAFVDVVAARLTLSYSREYERGIARLYHLNLDLLKKGQVIPATTDALRAQVAQAELQVHEATQALAGTTRALALLLNLPPSEVSTLQVRGALRDDRPLPATTESLIGTAMAARPDLLSYRLGLQRAQADAHLARANRYSDVYLLYQPYTFQDNSAFGTKSAHSWALGATVNLPIFNRNQGNIHRAVTNVTQSRVELASLERQVAHDVEEAVREFQLSLDRVMGYERAIVPSSRRVRDTAYKQFQGGEVSVLEYLVAQKDFNGVVREYRDALVRHRRSMLDLNTAVGVRILP